MINVSHKVLVYSTTGVLESPQQVLLCLLTVISCSSLLEKLQDNNSCLCALPHPLPIAAPGTRMSRLVDSQPARIALENAISKVKTNGHLDSSPRARNVHETDGGVSVGRRGVGWGEGVRLLTKWMPDTEHNMEKLKGLTVLPDEGIIYCPIPKVRWQN